MAPVTASGNEIARGSVYLDHDGDGDRGPDEPGLAGVGVSNGLEVVATDADGRWELPCEDGTVLFVVKPRDHAVPLDANNVPRFYYVHRPEGTPAALGLRYLGLEPTGPLPESIDFALRSRPEPDRFRVVAFADTQPESAAELDYVRDDVLAELIGIDAAFGITCGDILYDDLSLADRYQRLVGRIGIPWYAVAGNHEMNLMAPDDALSTETFRRHFGPTDYSFDVGRAHFVVLDTVEYKGVVRGSDDPADRHSGGYRGALSERQLRWLESDLALVPSDRLVVLAMHVPLASDFDPGAENANVADREKLFDLLEERRHLMAVAGHTHAVEHHYFGPEQGFDGERPLHLHTLATVSGSWWGGPRDERGIPSAVQVDGTPNGYTVLTIDGVEVSARYKAASLPADHQMRIVLDHAFHQNDGAIWRDFRPGELLGGPITASAVASTRVVVNLFDGGPRSRVWMRVDDGPEVELVRTRRVDPFVAELHGRNPELFKSFVEPEPSTHLWEGALGRALSPGAHVLWVRAVDEYGQDHRAQRVFEVLGP